MAFSTTLQTFIAVEVVQQGQTELKIISSPSVVDTAEISAITPFWNYLEGRWDETRTIGYLKSGVQININTPYATVQNILIPGAPAS